jgi:methylated-DNA-[protein]-cysteine S-methyltransferase
MTGSTADERAVADLLATAHAAVDAHDLDRLHAELVGRAARDGALDVAYRTVDSPLGPLRLATTPAGLVRVAFEGEGHDDVLTELAVQISPRILRSPARLDDVARQLEEYFDRRRRSFDLPVDLQLAHGFRREVLDHLRVIPFGATESYGVVAVATGHPRAVRAVGTACGHNPVPLVVPCHRVVRSDGTIGQYRGGVEAKRLLLDLEAS